MDVVDVEGGEWRCAAGTRGLKLRPPRLAGNLPTQAKGRLERATVGDSGEEVKIPTLFREGRERRVGHPVFSFGFLQRVAIGLEC